MADAPNDFPIGRGGSKSNPQSPLLFTPTTENRSTVVEDRNMEIANFEKEIDTYIDN